MPEPQPNARVVPVSLDEPLEPLAVESRCTHVLLVVTLGGRFVGDVILPATGSLRPEDQRRAIQEHLGEQLWRLRLRDAFTRAARGSGVSRPHRDPAVSVLVGAGRDARRLSDLLESLTSLEPPAHEVIVVEGHPPDGSVRGVCHAFSVRHLHEQGSAPAGAWNRAIAMADGEVVALIEADWVVDRRWLEGLGEPFADPLVAAVVGYGGPLEGRLQGSAGRVVYDYVSTQLPTLADSNCFVRREGFAQVGLVPDSVDAGAPAPSGRTAELCARLLAAGYRVVFDPARIAWRGRTPARRGGGRRLRLRGAGVAPVELGPCGGTESGSRVVAEAGPPLSVAIASYNRREPLARVLGALAEQSYPSERFEVLVVLDGSTDGSAERVRGLELPYSLRLLEQENRGLAASRNRGGREAGAPVVVFLDDDIVPEPQFLAEHAGGHADAREALVALGSCPPAETGSDLQSVMTRTWFADYYRRRSEPDHQWNYTDFGDGNISLPRSLLLETGGWDEEFARGAGRRQDWEFGIRLLQRGVRFVDRPRAIGWHHFELSFETALRNRRIEGRSDVLLGGKHPHLRGHLHLATLLEQAAETRLSTFTLAWRYPTPNGWAVRLGKRFALLPDRAGRRRLSYRIVVKLFAHAYLSGVKDALPSREQFREFVAPILSGETVETLPVWLDRPGAIEAPPAAGAIDLAIGYAARPLARVAAVDPECQWDWELVTERVVRAALDPFREAASETAEELEELVPGLASPLPTE